MSALIDAGSTIQGSPTPARARRGAVRGLGEVVRWLLRPIAIVVPVFLFATLVTYLLGAVSGLIPAALKLGDSATAAYVARVNNGITGDARRSTAELGKMIFDMKVDYAVRQIQGFLAAAP